MGKYNTADIDRAKARDSGLVTGTGVTPWVYTDGKTPLNLMLRFVDSAGNSLASGTVYLDKTYDAGVTYDISTDLQGNTCSFGGNLNSMWPEWEEGVGYRFRGGTITGNLPYRISQ